MTETFIPELKNVSETLLVPLFFKAKETIENGLIKDDAAVSIVDRIEYDFDEMAKDWKTQVLIAIRTEILDQVVNEYINSTTDPVIINLGAGLDTRHLRLKDAKWYQLDLEKPMLLRNIFFGKEEIEITKNIFDFSWIKEIKEKENVLIIIEGVLMYLPENRVKTLFKQIGLNFRDSFIVFDTIPKSYVKLKKHKSIDLQQAPFQWGNSSISQIEGWKYGFKKEKNYCYLSRHIRRWKTMAFLSIFPDIYNGLKISLMKIK